MSFWMKRGILLAAVAMMLSACYPYPPQRTIVYQPVKLPNHHGVAQPCNRAYCPLRHAEEPYRKRIRTRPVRIPWWAKEELVAIGLACTNGLRRHHGQHC